MQILLEPESHENNHNAIHYFDTREPDTIEQLMYIYCIVNISVH